MIVLDASVVADLVLRTARASRIEAVLGGTNRGALHAPALLDVEVLHVLRRKALEGDLTAARGAEAVRDLADLRIERHAHDLIAARIWELRSALTAYDAAYVALAELLDAPLLTLDRKLARTKGHAAKIELL